VDNYASNANKEIILMDHAGNVLITMRRKRLNFHSKWEAFRGDPQECEEPIFTLTKSLARFFTKTSAANVFVNGSRQIKHCDYGIEGSLCTPFCTIFSASGDMVAEVRRKEAKSDVMLGKDVLSLVIQPGIDQAF
ncbi:hypothetical protein KI387_010200, partial [Taxus chinensis]